MHIIINDIYRYLVYEFTNITFEKITFNVNIRMGYGFIGEVNLENKH